MHHRWAYLIARAGLADDCTTAGVQRHALKAGVSARVMSESAGQAGGHTAAGLPGCGLDEQPRAVVGQRRPDTPAYMAHAVNVAPGFTAWTGLVGKWWLDDTDSGTFGGVYLFASQDAADRSRETDLFRGMFANPAFKDVTVWEYDVIDGPTVITAPAA
jgi:putative monooxygenase ydhR